MGRQLVFRLTTLLLISLLISASILTISVLACRKPKPGDWDDPEWEEKKFIVDSLLELSSDISNLPKEAFKNPKYACCQTRVLRFMINVVIRQIIVEAYEGAINKLRHDVRGEIEKWIFDPWKTNLLDKLDYIIRLLEELLCIDKKPPIIASVLMFPETPNYYESVTIIAQVIDKESGVESVILSYQINSDSWVNVTMNSDDGSYVSEIPLQPYNTIVSYKVYAYDEADNFAISNTYSYLVIDSHPATIFHVEHTPTSPNYNETVTVSASVTEPPEASGVKNVTLLYKTNSDWQTTEMSLDANLYTGTIPPFPHETEVHYKILAFDNAENWVDSEVHSYPLVDTYPPLARIDEPTDGSYQAGIVSVKIFVDDDNFDRAELRIKDVIVIQWNSTGQHVFYWNTTAPQYPDGVYILQLVAYDQAGNFNAATIAVILDNTPPLIGIPTWNPEEPLAYDEVVVSVWVSESGHASGIKNVTLWYTIDDEWYFLKMEMPDGLWTATIPGQSAGVKVEFYIESYDNMGKDAKTSTYDYTVKVPPNLSPLANFRESAETVSTGEVIYFDASESHDPDGYIESYFWNFGDGTRITSANAFANHVYLDDGVYTVTLTVTDNDGSTATAASTKTVSNKSPVASFTEDKTTVLTGESISFDASSSEDSDGSIISHLWDFGDETTAFGVKVNHVYEDDGVYTVLLKVIDDDGATASISAVITVSNRPPVAFFTENATKVEKGEVIHFDASESYDLDGNIVRYFWDFGDGTNATEVTVDHAYVEDGNYLVTLTVTDNDGASSSISDTKIVEKDTFRWPLALLAAIGLGIAVLTATLLYGLYRIRKKRGRTSKSRSKPIVTLYVPSKLLEDYD
jgi:PKD repeat protein